MNENTPTPTPPPTSDHPVDEQPTEVLGQGTPTAAPAGQSAAGTVPPGYPPPGAYPPPTSPPPGPYESAPYGGFAGYQQGYPPPGYPPPRRLTRSRTDRMVGGVCGGLARYWNTDPALLRILTVVLTLVTGGALLVGYVIAWIAIPDDPATAPFAPSPGADQVGYAAGGNPPYADQAPGYQPPAPRERSYLGWAVVSLAALVVGLLALLGVGLPGDPSGWAVLGGVSLAILGVGLLVGAWFGRARWLVVLAVPLAFLTFAAGAAGSWLQDNPDWDRWTDPSTGGLTIGERTWRVTPADLTEDPLTYQLSAGEAVLDLTGLVGAPAAADAGAEADAGADQDQGGLQDATADLEVDIEAGVGLGQLVVLVPPSMELELDASVDAGDITVPGRDRMSGTDLDLSTTLEPLAAGQPGYTVTLDAVIGAGNLEVRREAA